MRQANQKKTICKLCCFCAALQEESWLNRHIRYTHLGGVYNAKHYKSSMAKTCPQITFPYGGPIAVSRCLERAALELKFSPLLKRPRTYKVAPSWRVQKWYYFWGKDTYRKSLTSKALDAVRRFGFEFPYTPLHGYCAGSAGCLFVDPEPPNAFCSS